MLKFYLHRPGIESGYIAWQVTILPLNNPPILAYIPQISKPRKSYSVIATSNDKHVKIILASAGNRTRVYRVAGDNSTTEPPMLAYNPQCQKTRKYGTRS